MRLDVQRPNDKFHLVVAPLGLDYEPLCGPTNARLTDHRARVEGGRSWIHDSFCVPGNRSRRELTPDDVHALLWINRLPPYWLRRSQP